MKPKTMTLAIAIIMLSLNLVAADTSRTPAKREPLPIDFEIPGSAFLLRGSYFMPSEAVFKNIYGSLMAPGAEFRLGGQMVAGWLEGTYIQRTGKLTFTQEETKLTLIPIEGGLLVRFATGNLMPYLGAGGGYYMYKEKSDALGEVKENKFGFCGVGGLSYHMSSFMLDLKVKYSSCKFKPGSTDTGVDPLEVNIGGLSLSLGLGLGF